MTNTTDFCWININQVPQSVINAFDSGNEVFNDFLKETALRWQNNGEAVTYLIVTENERKANCYTRIYGYVSINSMGLLYDTQGENRKYLPCVEIRMFAIAKQLRKRHDPMIKYSDMIFKLILQNLYELSTKVIGFRAIFLNANKDGFRLYKDNHFEILSDFVSPTDEEKIDISDTTPMLLFINDTMLYNIFS